MLEIFPVVAVEGNEDEQHDCERPHRRTSVTDERQRDTDHWHKADCHADIDEQVHEYTACHAISIYSSKAFSTPLGIAYYPPDQEDI